MYLDFFVDIPDVKGKITRKPKGNAVYINYEYGREYDRERKYNIPKRVIIGKQSKTDPTKMQPNQNYLTYFPDAELPEEKFDSNRSSCLKIGSHLVINKILDEYGIPELLSPYFNPKEIGLFEDLMALLASIIRIMLSTTPCLRRTCISIAIQRFLNSFVA